MKSQTQKYIDLITPIAKKRMVFDKLIFVKSEKYTLADRKSLYLTLAAYNSEINQWQKISYEVKTGFTEFSLHPTKITGRHDY